MMKGRHFATTRDDGGESVSVSRGNRARGLISGASISLWMRVTVAALGCQDATDRRAGEVIDAAGDASLPALDAAADRGRVEPDAAPDAMPDAMLDATLDAMPDAMPEPDMGPAPDEGPPPDAGPPACNPALSVVPTPPAARPFDLVTLRARGGTGAWRYAFIENASGALLNDRTGAYLAGEAIGAIDRVRLTDEGCAGEAIAQHRAGGFVGKIVLEGPGLAACG